MIQKLRFRFILLAMASITILLLVIVGASNYLSYMKLVDDEQSVISELERFEAYYQAIMSETEAVVEIPPEALEPQPTPTEPNADVPEDHPEEQLPQEPQWGPVGGPGDPKWEAWVAWNKGHGRGDRFDDHGPMPWQEPVETETPTPEPTSSPTPPPAPSPIVVTVPRRQLSPEIPYESRYFIVTLDREGNVLDADMAHIVSVSEAEAAAYALTVQQGGGLSGRIGNYFYHGMEAENGTAFLFLDCQRDIATFFNSFVTSVVISAGGLLIVFVLLLLVSKQIVRPVAESYQKQKEFISAAGHELRTPLSTISADAEVLEMEIGENEWLTDIETQTRRMAELTNSLLTLSRMDEGRLSMPMMEFPLSDLVEDSVGGFALRAERQGILMETAISPGISMTGNETAIRQLVGILLDNAIKYSLGEVRISLGQKDGRTTLAVENSAEPVTEEQLRQFFDRFYRTEASRNSETGGYGLGLAIAKGIVEKHRGAIAAKQPVPGLIRMEIEFSE